MKYNRTELGCGIGFSTVIDEKFKTNTLSVRFITKLSADKAAENAIAIGVVSTSGGKYKTLAQLNEKLSSLYGASCSSSASKRGDIQILGVGGSWLDNRFAFDGEDVTGEMLDVLCGCIFSPNTKDGAFDNESFMITRKDVLDRIESEINNKRGYAYSRATEVAFRGEAAENSCYGKKANAEAVTAESALKAYNELLRTAQIEIFYIAPTENEAVEKRLREEFSAVEREVKSYEFTNYSPAKESVERANEELDVNQSKMVMCFKSDSDDTKALKMLSVIFGETPTSKLFMNVREKLSLCYYCASRIVASKGALFVDSGVEKANIEKAEAEILRQLEEIKNGNITDDEMSGALLAVDNSLTGVGDTPSSYTSWYFERFFNGDKVTPVEQSELYRAVTKERIVEAAKSLTLDSIYLMLNKEVSE